MLDTITLLQFAVAFGVLAYGSYWDLKKREVANYPWALGIAGGFIIAFIAFNEQFLLFMVYMIPIIIVGVGGFFFWDRFSNYIGAADIKALIMLTFVISYYTFLVMGVAIFLAACYAAAMLFSGRIKLSEIKKIQAPFVPFFLAGLIAVFLYIAAVV